MSQSNHWLGSRQAVQALSLILILAGASIGWAQTGALPIVVSSTTSPAVAQPAVSVLTLVASGFPSGTITSDLISLKLQPATGAAGPALSAVVTSLALLPANGRRITFT